MRGKSSYRSTKIARRSASPLQSPRICARRLSNAAGATTKPAASVARCPLVQRLLDPLRLAAVVFGTADLAAADVSKDGAGAGQVLAIDMARRIPQFRAHDGFGALIKHALHRDYDHRARRLVVDDKTFRERRIGGDAGAPDYPNGLADAGNEKQQRHPRIADDVAQ